MKSRFKFSLVAVGLAGAAVSCFAGGKVELVPVFEVRILDTSVFAPAVKADVAYVLALDPDRLLAPFRREAGLPEKAKSYGNWESCGLDGHTLGHYLSALAGLIASGTDAARRWEHRRVFDPLYRHEDKLTGLHANTQIPKFVGLARTAHCCAVALRPTSARALSS